MEGHTRTEIHREAQCVQRPERDDDSVSFLWGAWAYIITSWNVLNKSCNLTVVRGKITWLIKNFRNHPSGTAKMLKRFQKWAVWRSERLSAISVHSHPQEALEKSVTTHQNSWKETVITWQSLVWNSDFGQSSWPGCIQTFTCTHERAK